MIEGTRYLHTNLVARDWRKLAGFYESLFGCVPIPPERDYSAADVEAGTGVPGSGIAGVHLRLPGHGADGPTFEIYSGLIGGVITCGEPPGIRSRCLRGR